jgi:predicted RNase H-like nuclease
MLISTRTASSGPFASFRFIAKIGLIQSVKRRLLSPPLECTPKLAKFLAIDTNSLRGAALKSNEDALDAIVCAYIAYYYWFWGSTGTHLFGDLESGYIIVPTLERSPDRCAAEPAPRA